MIAGMEAKMTTPTTAVDEAVGDAILLLVLAVLVVLVFADFIAKHFETVVATVVAVSILLVGQYYLGKRLQ